MRVESLEFREVGKLKVERLKVKRMEIEIRRYKNRPWGIDGELLIGGKKVCGTVEHPEYAKPAGNYPILPAAGVSARMNSHPFAHGDGAMSATRGEIIVGERALSGVVIHSAKVYATLSARLKKARQRGREVRLRIEERY